MRTSLLPLDSVLGPRERRVLGAVTAVLIALVQVRRDGASAAEDGTNGTTNFSRMDQPLDMPLCCDNFM